MYKWNAIRKCSYMQSAQLPHVTEFKYLGSTLQSDGGRSTEINKTTQCGWNNWRKISGVLCDKRVPPHVKGKILKMIVQPAMLYGMETVPVTSANVTKLEVTEMQMCIWTCGHTLSEHVRNENITERLNVESIAERCRKARLRWFGYENSRDQDERRKKDSGDGTIREKKARKTEAEMDVLCQPRHESHRNDERRGP